LSYRGNAENGNERVFFFSMYKDHFETAIVFEREISQISWYLPKHYTMVSVPKSGDLERICRFVINIFYKIGHEKINNLHESA